MMADTGTIFEVEDDAQIEVVDQPIEVMLMHDTELHKTILKKLQERRELSEKFIKERYDDWDRVDEHVRCYIDLNRKARKADHTTDPSVSEMPFKHAIVVPLSYTLLWTRLVGLMAIFTDKDPILPITGSGDPADVDPAKAMEAILSYDVRQSSTELFFLAHCMDAEKYGFAAAYDEFHSEQGWTYKENPLSKSPLLSKIVELMTGQPLMPTKEWGIKREYNRWKQLDPFTTWPDPRVPMSEIEQMEFFGHTVFRSYLQLSKNIMPNGPYFPENMKQLKNKKAKSERRSNETGRSRSKNQTVNFELESGRDEANPFLCIDQMQVDLIPREWKLSEEENPQIWQFAWGEDEIIIRAHPLKYDHGEFTYSVSEPNLDTHTLFNPGMIENIDGLQRMTNWMQNSHIDNLRRMINNACLYSPRYIEEDDLLNPGPAGHIRFTEEGEDLIARGVPVSSFFHQASMQDVTGVHMQASGEMYQMAKEMLAVNEPAMGQITETKRTLGELQRVIFSQERRIGLTAKIIDFMAIKPLVYRAIHNRQQYTTLEKYYEIVGEDAKRYGLPPMLYGKQHIMGNLDYVSNTGTIPPDPARFAQAWTQVLIAAGKIPQLFQPDADGTIFDIREGFNEFVRTVGIEDVKHFYKKIQMPPINVMPDEQIEKEKQKGNIIPAGAMNDPLAAMGGRNGR